VKEKIACGNPTRMISVERLSKSGDTRWWRRFYRVL
jgi:hypothetical protein